MYGISQSNQDKCFREAVKNLEGVNAKRVREKFLLIQPSVQGRDFLQVRALDKIHNSRPVQGASARYAAKRKLQDVMLQPGGVIWARNELASRARPCFSPRQS